MLAKVVGTRWIDFTDAKGQRIVGTKIFCVLEPSAAGDIIGQATDDVFVREGTLRLPEFKLGEKYDFEFQQNGFGKKPVLVEIKEYIPSKAS